MQTAKDGREAVSESFMTLLRRHRIAAGLDQSDIAKSLKVSVSAVSLWEAGKSIPKAKKIPKLARILGISAMALTRLIDPEPEPAK